MNSFSVKEKTSSYLLMLICALLFIYVAVRSYLIGITWDEAYNYLFFTRKGFFFPVHFNGISANNHLLNTWLTRIVTGNFGLSEFTLRIPVIFFYAMYLFFTFKISNEFVSPVQKVSSLIIFNLNPYLLDFFSLARGYGLSYGLLAGSLWYLYLFLENNFEKKLSFRSLIFAMLAVLAHLTLIHFLLLLFCLILFVDFIHSDKNLKSSKRIFEVLKKNKIAIILLLVFLSYVIPMILGLAHAEAFFFGGTKGFWQDTVVSVFDRSLYENNYPVILKLLLSIGSLIIICTALFFVIKNMRTKNSWNKNIFLPAVTFLLIICSVASIVQHYLFGILFLTERTALYLLILFSYLFVFLIHEISEKWNNIKYISVIISLLLVFHFANSMNMKYVLEWKWDADVREMIHDLDSLKAETPKEKFSMDVGMNLEFELPFNFYKFKNNLTWLSPAVRSMKFHPLSDFYLYFESDLEKINLDSFVVLKSYPLFNNKLLKRKYKPSHYEILFSKMLDYDSPADSVSYLNSVSEKYSFSGNKSCFTDKENTYSGGIKYPLPDSLAGKTNCIVSAKAMVLMENINHADANLIISFDRGEKPYSWNATGIREFVSEKNKWTEILFTVFVPGEIQKGDVLNIYVANNNTPVYVDNLEARWLQAIY